jgi:hypothetical protein
MSDARTLHRMAMAKADEAMAARRMDRLSDANTLYREAFQLESQAAMDLIDDIAEEPTRSVLFRSAATLAVNGGLYASAAYLIGCALEGNPPAEIREELCELLESLLPARESAGTVVGPSLGDAERRGRLETSWSSVSSGLDELRKAIAQRNLTGGALSSQLIETILRIIRDGLRTITGDTRLSLNVFAVNPDVNPREWISLVLPPLVPDDDWALHAKYVADEFGESVLRGEELAAGTVEIATNHILSMEVLKLLDRDGIRAVAAWPVWVRDKAERERPALALLGLASDSRAFADDMTIQTLRSCVSLLGIAIAIGRRDDLRSESRDGATFKSGRPSDDE